MDYYPYNRKVLRACGLNTLPDRRTFDRRLSTISVDIKERIAAMANLVVKEKLVDAYIIAIDTCPLLKAKGHLWHKLLCCIIQKNRYKITTLAILKNGPNTNYAILIEGFKFG